MSEVFLPEHVLSEIEYYAPFDLFLISLNAAINEDEDMLFVEDEIIPE